VTYLVIGLLMCVAATTKGALELLGYQLPI